MGDVFVLQQVSSSAELAQTANALKQPDVKGLSVRYPLTAVASSLKLLDDARKLADQYGKELQIRFMAGRWVPQTANVGRTYMVASVSGGQVKCPVPFNTDGSPNVQFENYYATEVQRHITWCIANRVKVLHLSWYARDWAEVANAADLRALQGYSESRFITAHKRLVDRVQPMVSGIDLVPEWPMSGSGPLVPFIDQVSTYIKEKIPKAWTQANGVDEKGVFGAGSDTTTEKQKVAAWHTTNRAGQMIQPQQFDWPKVFAQCTEKDLLQLEVYTPSFSGSGGAALVAAMDDWVETDNSAEIAELQARRAEVTGLLGAVTAELPNAREQMTYWVNKVGQLETDEATYTQEIADIDERLAELGA